MFTFPAFKRLSAPLVHVFTAIGTWLFGSVPGSLRPADGSAGPDESVTVATFDRTTDAHIAKGRLEAEGIKTLLFDDNMVQMDWLYAIALGGIKVKVGRRDENHARQILQTDYSHDLDDLDFDNPET